MDENCFWEILAIADAGRNQVGARHAMRQTRANGVIELASGRL